VLSQLSKVHRRCRQDGLDQHVLATPPLRPMHAMANLGVSDNQLHELLAVTKSLPGLGSLEMICHLQQLVIE
jgi:hypothetical protein